MTPDLHRFLPSSFRMETDYSRASRSICGLWSEMVRTLDDTTRERLESTYSATFDADMKPRMPTTVEGGETRALVNLCKSIIDRFDTTVSVTFLQAAGSPGPSGPLRVESSDWGLFGAVAHLAELKYLQGRLYLADNKMEGAWECAVKLYHAGSLCFQAGAPEPYMTGLRFRERYLSLVCQVFGYGRGGDIVARNAIAFTLSALDSGFFARAFLASLAFRAVELLRKLSDNPLRDDALPAFLQQLADTEEYDTENTARGTLENARPVEDSMTPRHYQLLRLEPTAELVGAVCQRCAEAMAYPAQEARGKLKALPHFFMPRELIDAGNESAGGSPVDVPNRLPDLENAAGLVFANTFARRLCERATGNGFFWYYPLAQHRGIAAALSTRAFETERRRRPHSFKEVVEAGYLANPLVDPFSGGSLVYDEIADVVSGDLGESELQHWVPPVDVSKKLRWRIPTEENENTRGE